MTLVAFGSNVVDIFKVNDAMTAKGWSLNALQKPNRYKMTTCLVFTTACKEREKEI